MATSNRLFANISTIHMATAQSTIFSLLRIIQSFGTSHLPNICLLQIYKLFQHWKSSTYSVTVRRIIVRKLQTAYFEIHNFQATAHHTIIFLLSIYQLFVYCKSTNYFTTGNRLNNWLLCIEKLYDTFKSPILKRFNDLYGYCAKSHFVATAHVPIIYLV